MENQLENVVNTTRLKSSYVPNSYKRNFPEFHEKIVQHLCEKGKVIDDGQGLKIKYEK